MWQDVMIIFVITSKFNSTFGLILRQTSQATTLLLVQLHTIRCTLAIEYAVVTNDRPAFQTHSCVYGQHKASNDYTKGTTGA